MGSENCLIKTDTLKVAEMPDCPFDVIGIVNRPRRIAQYRNGHPNGGRHAGKREEDPMTGPKPKRPGRQAKRCDPGELRRYGIRLCVPAFRAQETPNGQPGDC